MAWTWSSAMTQNQKKQMVTSTCNLPAIQKCLMMKKTRSYLKILTPNIWIINYLLHYLQTNDCAKTQVDSRILHILFPFLLLRFSWVFKYGFMLLSHFVRFARQFVLKAIYSLQSFYFSLPWLIQLFACISWTLRQCLFEHLFSLLKAFSILIHYS